MSTTASDNRQQHFHSSVVCIEIRHKRQLFPFHTAGVQIEENTIISLSKRQAFKKLRYRRGVQGQTIVDKFLLYRSVVSVQLQVMINNSTSTLQRCALRTATSDKNSPSTRQRGRLSITTSGTYNNTIKLLALILALPAPICVGLEQRQAITGLAPRESPLVLEAWDFEGKTTHP